MKHQKNDRRENEIRHFSNLEHIWWGVGTAAGQRRYDNKFSEFVKFCKPDKSCKILEIGCGDGEFTRRLVPASKNIIATDITPEVVKRGRRKIKYHNVKFLIDDAEALKFPDNSFDVVCGISILHHVNCEKSLTEAFRVLKKGGQIFFTEPNLLNPHVFLGLHIPMFRKRMEFSDNETALIRWQVKGMLQRIGFKELSVKNYDFLHPKTPTRFINLAQNLSNILDDMPVVKEISGSLIIWAKK